MASAAASGLISINKLCMRGQVRQQNSKDPTWLVYTVYGNLYVRAVSASTDSTGQRLGEREGPISPLDEVVKGV